MPGAEAYTFIYMISIIWILLGMVVGWMPGRTVGGAFIGAFLFGMVGFLIFPGMWGGI